MERRWSRNNGPVGLRWHLMTGHGEKLARKQEEAIAALLTQRNTEEAARAVGVTPKTLLRWMKLPPFEAAYREARRAAFAQSVARLQQASSAAASTLLKVMVDPSTPASTRVRAAESVLTHAAKGIEIEDLDARLTALEQAVESNRPR
jgi:transposase-like protein